MLRPYELVVIVSPKVQDDAVPQVAERVTKFITDLGGQVESQNIWGRRRLAYPIARFIEGNYLLTHLQIEPSASASLESNLKLNEEVIRHLLVRRDS